MTFKEQIPSEVWLSNIPDVRIGTTVAVDATFTDNYTGATIYNERLYPNASGEIVICGVREIVLSSMRQAIAARQMTRTFTLTVKSTISSTTQLGTKAIRFPGGTITTPTYQATTISLSFTCFYAECEVDSSPLGVVRGSWLTRYTAREIAPDAVEKLTYYKYKDGSRCSISVQYQLEGVANTQSARLAASFVRTNNVLITYDVSPANITKKLGLTRRLLWYKVVITTGAGNTASATFTVDYNTPQRTAVFQYRNPFGQPEYLTVYGNDKENRKFEKSIALVDGVETVYKTKLTDSHVITTAIMRPTQREVMEDFFASEEVWLVENGELVAQVIIDEITHETSDSYDALDSYKFTWRRADSKQRGSVSVRVFDDTFAGQFE